MRASQLDAARLDDELTAMLKENFMRIFGLFQPVCQASLVLERAFIVAPSFKCMSSWLILRCQRFCCSASSQPYSLSLHSSWTSS